MVIPRSSLQFTSKHFKVLSLFHLACIITNSNHYYEVDMQVGVQSRKKALLGEFCINLQKNVSWI